MSENMTLWWRNIGLEMVKVGKEAIAEEAFLWLWALFERYFQDYFFILYKKNISCVLQYKIIQNLFIPIPLTGKEILRSQY